MLFVLPKNILEIIKFLYFTLSLFFPFLAINIWRSKALILILGQLTEYYIENIFTEKFGCPKANFGPPHKLVDNLA